MDEDREAFEFAYALYLARQVDPEAARLIVDAAEAGLIRINELKLVDSPSASKSAIR